MPQIGLRHVVLMLSLAISAAGGPALAQQAAWPTKPVAIVTGGANDVEIGLYKDKLSAAFDNKPFILDHRPGANNAIAGAYVAKAAPDGHVLLQVNGSYVIAPAFDDKLPFDVIRDFAPVSLLSSVPVYLQAYPGFPANNFREYIAYAKANPGVILWGADGVGGSQHLIGEWMHDLIGSPATFIHYKTGTAVTNDMVAGRIHVQPRPLSGTIGFVKAGKLKLLGVIGPKRDRNAPDLPSAQEAGLKDIDQPTFLGIVAPAKTDRAIINRLSAELAKIVKLPDVREKLEPLGNNQIGSTPEELGKYMTEKVVAFKKLVKDKNIKPEL